MDQTASKNKKLLQYVRKFRQDSSLDCNLNLCSGRHNEKKIENRFDSLHYFTDFEHHSI